MIVEHSIRITGIHLLRIGPHVIVRAEIDGHWVDVIQETLDSQFSHIVEPAGMFSAAEKGL